jgi:ribose 5-phosphate isomerase RpiB
MTEYEQNIEIMKDLRNRLDKVLDNTPTETSTVKYPDATKHFYVSVVKSAVRIGAASALIMGSFMLAGALFILAEILGIVEEIV